MNTYIEEIKKIVEEKLKNTLDGDKDALVAHYAADVTCYDLAQVLEFQGQDALNERLTVWFESYKGPIHQEIKNFKVEAGEDVAMSHYLMRTYGVGVDGESRDMWYRVTSGYKKIGGKWLIVHEHISEPIDLNTGKGMFGLKP